MSESPGDCEDDFEVDVDSEDSSSALSSFVSSEQSDQSSSELLISSLSFTLSPGEGSSSFDCLSC